MNAIPTACLPAMLLWFASVLPSQQLLWQIPSGPSYDSYLYAYEFGDYDRDGVRDILTGHTLNDWGLQGPQSAGFKIVSGATGAILEVLADLQMRAPLACGGDLDGDGSPDVLMKFDGLWGYPIRAWSARNPGVIWQVGGVIGANHGYAILGDLDVNADGRPDMITITSSTTASDVYVYDNSGALLYTVPCLALGAVAASLDKMGDVDGDGCDDFVVGCGEGTGRGMLLLVSGQTGTIIRQSFGLLPGDRIEAHASNMGDLDGDGVNDYAGFPWWSAWRAIITVFSGQTGAVIRTWDAYSNSAVTGEDVDLDGVPDLVIGSDYAIFAPQVYGRTRAFSGRDGTELWRVDNFLAPPGSGFSNGTSGWMEYAASLGTRPGSPYPVIAWLDLHYWATNTAFGRVRAYDRIRAGQGPVTGTACTSTGALPQIGVRTTAPGSRVTIAKSHANALGALWLGLNALPAPVDLAPLGASGCALYVPADAAFLRQLGTTGIDRGCRRRPPVPAGAHRSRPRRRRAMARLRSDDRRSRGHPDARAPAPVGVVGWLRGAALPVNSGGGSRHAAEVRLP